MAYFFSLILDMFIFNFVNLIFKDGTDANPNMAIFYPHVFNFNAKWVLVRNNIEDSSKVTGKMLRNAAFFKLANEMGFKERGTKQNGPNL